MIKNRNQNNLLFAIVFDFVYCANPPRKKKKCNTYVWSVKTNAAAKGRHQVRVRTLWQYRLSSFQAGGIKLERFFFA